MNRPPILLGALLWLSLGGCDGGSPLGDASSDATVAVDATLANDAGRDASAIGDGAAQDAQSSDGSADASQDSSLDGAAASDGNAGDASLLCTQTPSPDYSTPVDRSCQSASDCSMAYWPLDCCGNMLVTGVARSAAEALEAAATYCQQQQLPCGCPSGPSAADDGTSEDATHPYATVDCIDGGCVTSFSGPATTPCGPSLSCDAITQICVKYDPIGATTDYSCELVVGCGTIRDCRCNAERLCGSAFERCDDRGPNAIDCLCPTCQ